MTAVIRLPVAPRPFSDELLSSWMARVATRFGLEVPDMTVYLAGQGETPPTLRQIDDTAPDPELLKIWARGCRDRSCAPRTPVIEISAPQPAARLDFG